MTPLMTNESEMVSGLRGEKRKASTAASQTQNPNFSLNFVNLVNYDKHKGQSTTLISDIRLQVLLWLYYLHFKP